MGPGDRGGDQPSPACGTATVREEGPEPLPGQGDCNSTTAWTRAAKEPSQVMEGAPHRPGDVAQRGDLGRTPLSAHQCPLPSEWVSGSRLTQGPPHHGPRQSPAACGTPWDFPASVTPWASSSCHPHHTTPTHTAVIGTEPHRAPPNIPPHPHRLWAHSREQDMGSMQEGSGVR